MNKIIQSSKHDHRPVPGRPEATYQFDDFLSHPVKEQYLTFTSRREYEPIIDNLISDLLSTFSASSSGLRTCDAFLHEPEPSSALKDVFPVFTPRRLMFCEALNVHANPQLAMGKAVQNTVR